MIEQFEQALAEESAQAPWGKVVMASRAERELLKSAYPNKRWAEKVDAMSDSQVIAVIMRLKSQNKL